MFQLCFEEPFVYLVIFCTLFVLFNLVSAFINTVFLGRSLNKLPQHLFQLRRRGIGGCFLGSDSTTPPAPTPVPSSTPVPTDTTPTPTPTPTPAPSAGPLTAAQIWALRESATCSLTVRFDDPWPAGTQYFKGSAFFITSDGYCCTAGHNSIQSPSDGGISNGQLMHASQVLATVTNLNGNGGVTICECRFAGVDGSGDCSVFKVAGVTNQAVIPWGDSRATQRGDVSYVLGDPLGQDEQSICEGIVRDNSFTDPTGEQVVESVLVSNNAMEGNSGSPILNSNGEAIGIYTFGVSGSAGFGGGVASVIAKYVTDTIIAADRANQSSPQFDIVSRRFLKPFMGVSFSGATAFDYVQIGNNNTQLLGCVVAAESAGDKVLANVNVNDVITSINGTTVGCFPGMLAPSSVTWFLPPTATVQIHYQTGQPNTNWQTFSTSQTLIPYPIAYDYPLSGTENIKIKGRSLRKSNKYLVKPTLLQKHYNSLGTH